MPEKDIKGDEINVTGNKQWQKNYRESDMESLYRRKDFHSWGEMVQWLEENGDQDNEFTPGEVVAMTEDLRQLERSGQKFTNSPDQAYRMAHQNRAKAA